MLEDLFPFDDELLANAAVKRPSCSTCARPLPQCVCHCIAERHGTATVVVVLQHPAEQNRQLRTVPLLQAGLVEEKCQVHVGKRFKNLDSIITPRTALLFPGRDAVNCGDVDRGTYDTLICLDGTWPQARRLYQKNPELQRLPKVMLGPSDRRSVYLIHTQPTDMHLSSLESVGRALEQLEGIEGLEERLVRPLKEMVRTQFKFGAQAHGTQAEARIVRKQEVKQGYKDLTVAPKLLDFDYDSF